MEMRGGVLEFDSHACVFFLLLRMYVRLRQVRMRVHESLEYVGSDVCLAIWPKPLA